MVVSVSVPRYVIYFLWTATQPSFLLHHINPNQIVEKVIDAKVLDLMIYIVKCLFDCNGKAIVGEHFVCMCVGGCIYLCYTYYWVCTTCLEINNECCVIIDCNVSQWNYSSWCLYYTKHRESNTWCSKCKIQALSDGGIMRLCSTCIALCRTSRCTNQLTVDGVNTLCLDCQAKAKYTETRMKMLCCWLQRTLLCLQYWMPVLHTPEWWTKHSIWQVCKI